MPLTIYTANALQGQAPNQPKSRPGVTIFVQGETAAIRPPLVRVLRLPMGGGAPEVIAVGPVPKPAGNDPSSPSIPAGAIAGPWVTPWFALYSGFATRDLVPGDLLVFEVDPSEAAGDEVRLVLMVRTQMIYGTQMWDTFRPLPGAVAAVTAVTTLAAPPPPVAPAAPWLGEATGTTSSWGT